MRVTVPIGLCLAMAVLAAAWFVVPWAEATQWAAFRQREFQNAMARSLRAIQSGDAAAIWSLCLATTAYGFVHALGPGHGKILLGGAALASGATMRRMATLTVASSLAQSGTAILFVAVLLGAVKLTSSDAVAFTETWLVPISYAAVGGIGLVLVLRGLRAVGALSRRNPHAHHQECGCGHAHAPTLSEVRSLTSARDAAALIVSIAIRPCTGALFLLVIAARFDVFAVGVLAVIAMGFGTAFFNLTIAGSGIVAHRLAHVGEATSGPRARHLSAALHLLGGATIMVFSLLLLAPHLG